MPDDDDEHSHNGGHPGTPGDQSPPPDVPPPPSAFPPSPFQEPRYPPAPPPGLGAEPPPPPPSPPPPPPGLFSPAYPPGYPPPPGAAPTYQAPAPWVPTTTSPTAGYAPFGPPPGPPVVGAPGLPNGSGHAPSSPRPRRRVVTAIVLVVVVSLVAAGIGVALTGGSSTAPSSLSTTSASPAARQLLQSALAAAGQVNAFHYVATSSLSGSTQRTVGDAGPDSGRQVITVGAQKFTVLVIGTACFVRGNAAALNANLGLSTVAATAHVDQWISLARTDAPYASVYAAVTATSALSDNVTLTPKAELPDQKIDGRRVQVVTGSIAPVTVAGQTIAPKGTATLAARARSPHLPVRYTERGTQNRQQIVTTVTFSRWGEVVDVTAPLGAVSYASLGVGSGSVPSSPSGTVLT